MGWGFRKPGLERGGLAPCGWRDLETQPFLFLLCPREKLCCSSLPGACCLSQGPEQRGGLAMGWEPRRPFFLTNWFTNAQLQ